MKVNIEKLVKAQQERDDLLRYCKELGLLKEEIDNIKTDKLWSRYYPCSGSIKAEILELISSHQGRVWEQVEGLFVEVDD